MTLPVPQRMFAEPLIANSSLGDDRITGIKKLNSLTGYKEL
jgi:hypothetical protein